MSATPRFISDTHFLHRNVMNFPLRGEVVRNSDYEDHTEWGIEQWNKTVGKRDPVYLLGDVAFSREGITILSKLRGEIKIILGNHDEFPAQLYLDQNCRILPSLFKYRKDFWLSHAPIHPHELRGKVNIHGHVHDHTIDDERYLNVCSEHLNGCPISLEDATRAFHLNLEDRVDFLNSISK